MYYYRYYDDGRDVGFKVECSSLGSGGCIGIYDNEISAMIMVHFLNGGCGVSYATVLGALDGRKK